MNPAILAGKGRSRSSGRTRSGVGPLEALREAFRDEGWTEVVASGDSSFPLRFRHGSFDYVVYGQTLAPQAWERVVRAFLALAILSSRVSPAVQGSTPLVLVISPSATAALDERLAEFVGRVAPDTAWLLMDRQGRVFPHAPGLEFLRRDASASPPRFSQRNATTNLFTDTHQWLLKVMLAPLFPQSQLSAPRDRPLRNATVLAELAQVSYPATARFVALLEAEGFLDRSGGALRLVSFERLFERWRAAVSSTPREVGVRGARGPLTDAGFQILLSVAAAQPAAERRFVLGLFGACDALGLGIVRGAPRHLYVSRLEGPWLDELGLVEVARAEAAELTIREARWPESIFRAAVPTQAGVPATDVIQSWLDVSHHAARGAEQAAHLWRHALEPAIRQGA